MPRVILFLSVAFALWIVGSEILFLYSYLQPLPWNEWLPLIETFRLLSVTRVQSCAPLLPYISAAIIAGVAEGVYWRSRQVWRGYHRSLWQLSGAPLILAVALFVSWAMAFNKPNVFRLWGVCVFVAVASFTLSAGYKVSTVR